MQARRRAGRCAEARATGSVFLLRGEGGAGDSCTLNGVTKTESDGIRYGGCE